MTTLNRQSLVKMVFTDFSSGFNTIQPHLMAQKVVHLRVNPRLILWTFDFSSNRSQQVKSSQAVSTGAPQGCALSPFLYILNPNNCQATSSDHTCLKYTDDAALVGFIKSNTASLEGFESEVQGFVKWCADKFPVVNAKKIKEMIIDFY